MALISIFFYSIRQLAIDNPRQNDYSVVMKTTRLKELRQQRGVTLATMATALGVTRQAVSRWELGQSEMSLSVASNVSAFLGVPLDDLVCKQDSS